VGGNFPDRRQAEDEWGDEIDLRVYFDLIRRWFWLILLCGVVAGASGYGTSLLATPIYQAKSTLLVQQARNPGDVQYNDILASQRIATTYAQLMARQPILERVAAMLGVDIAVVDAKDNSATGVTDIKVAAVRDTQLVEVTIEAISPNLAAAVANALPQVFIEELKQLQSDRFAGSKANLQRQMDFLQQQMADTQVALSALGQDGDASERTRLAGLLSEYQNNYTGLVQSYENLRLTEIQSVDTVTLWETAALPERPVRPRKLLNALLAAIVGGMLALGAVFLMEFLDDRIRSPEEMTRLLGLPWLGSVAQIPGVVSDGHSPANLIALREPRHPITEAVRGLRTNLQFANVDRQLATLTVTSVNPGEGKYTVIANLAVVMAQAGLHVVLVDADLRRPVQHRIFGLSKSPGLTDLLLTPEAPPAPFLRQPMPNLSILSGGKHAPNPAELVGSRRMQEVIAQLRDQADLVLFDAPPVLAVTDSQVLGRQTDATLLVLDVTATTRRAATHALDTLRQVGVPLVGVVANRISEHNHQYYWQGYRDYYYHRDGETADEENGAEFVGALNGRPATQEQSVAAVRR